MEYAKDEIFQIKYNTKLNRLEMGKESWTSRVTKKIRNHKLLTTTMIAFFIFATLNMVMIYSFMKILEKL